MGRKLDRIDKEAYLLNVNTAKFEFVDSSEDWEHVLDLYKAVQWFRKEITVPGREDLKFKSAPRMVEIEHNGVTKLVDVKGILGSLVRKKGCKVKAVIFHNFIRVEAEMVRDDISDAFAIRVNGVDVIKQGGYKWCIPDNLDLNEEVQAFYFCGYEYENCYYEMDPFKRIKY